MKLYFEDYIPLEQQMLMQRWEEKQRLKKEDKNPYWLIETQRWYDPEGLDNPNDYDIEYSGTEDECRKKLQSIKDNAIAKNRDYSRIIIEKETKNSITIYYQSAMSRSTYSVVKNPNLE